MKVLRKWFPLLMVLVSWAGGVAWWFIPQSTHPVAEELVAVGLLWLAGMHLLIQRMEQDSRWLHAFPAFFVSIMLGSLYSPWGVMPYLFSAAWIATGVGVGGTLFVLALQFFPELFLWMILWVSGSMPAIPYPPGVAIEDFHWGVFAAHLLIAFLGAIGLGMAYLFRKEWKNEIAPHPFMARRHAEKEGTGAQPLVSPKPEPMEIVVPKVEELIMPNVEPIPVPSDLGGILESVVFFMGKNFKAYSALGFLSFDDGKTFVINAHWTRSEKFRPEVLVLPGSGIVGEAIREPHGFMSGSLKNYPSKVEYYSKSDEVSSIIISRILDEETQKVMGLLVVDSQMPNGFSSADKETLNRFSVIASKLISNARMRKILEVNHQQGEKIYQIAKQLASEKYIRGIIGVLLDNLGNVFDVDRIVLTVFSPEKKKGVILKIVTDSERKVQMDALQEEMVFPVDDPLCLYGNAFVQKICFLESSALKENRYRFSPTENKDLSPADVLVAPLKNDSGKIIAVFGLESQSSGRLDTNSKMLLETILANASSAVTRAEFFAKLEQQATMDGLTKIANHRHFQDTMDKRLARNAKSGQPLGLLLMDIDHFKKFNDTYGHPVGDKVLQLVAGTISKTIRPTDFVARYGGEEFVVIIESGQDILLQMAERIREAIASQRLAHEEKALQVTVSIGAACFPLHAQQKKDLIEFADQAMYRSKEGGRNRVTLWDAN